MSKSKKNTIDLKILFLTMGLMLLGYLFYPWPSWKKMFNGLRKGLFHHLNLYKNYGSKCKILMKLKKTTVHTDKKLRNIQINFLKKVTENLESFSYNKIIIILQAYSFE